MTFKALTDSTQNFPSVIGGIFLSLHIKMPLIVIRSSQTYYTMIFLNIIYVLHHKMFGPLFMIRISSDGMKLTDFGKKMDKFWMKAAALGQTKDIIWIFLPS